MTSSLGRFCQLCSEAFEEYEVLTIRAGHRNQVFVCIQCANLVKREWGRWVDAPISEKGVVRHA